MIYRLGRNYRLIVEPTPRGYRFDEQPTHNYGIEDRYGHEQDYGEIPAAALPIGNDRLKKILESAFPPYGHGGYPALFIAAGCELVCTSCGIDALTDEFADDDTDLEYHVDDAYHDRPTGEQCASCNEWIFEPFCADCGTAQSELNEPHRMTGNRLEYNDSGDHCVCRQCIHNALIRTREAFRDEPVLWRGGGRKSVDNQHAHRTQATIIAPQTYELSNCWYAGIFGKHAEEARRAEILRDQSELAQAYSAHLSKEASL